MSSTRMLLRPSKTSLMNKIPMFVTMKIKLTKSSDHKLISWTERSERSLEKSRATHMTSQPLLPISTLTTRRWTLLERSWQLSTVISRNSPRARSSVSKSRIGLRSTMLRTASRMPRVRSERNSRSLKTTTISRNGLRNRSLSQDLTTFRESLVLLSTLPTTLRSSTLLSSSSSQPMISCSSPLSVS